MLITEEYKKLNEELHNKSPKYGISGKRHAYLIDEFIDDSKIVLDYGCGKGTLLKTLKNRPYKIHEYDPCISGKSELPYPADLVFCGDVLEHIEPKCLNDVLYHIRALTKDTVIFVIALAQGKRRLPDGTFAHRIVKDSNWWLNKINCLYAGFDIIAKNEYKKELIVVYKNAKRKSNIDNALGELG